MTRLWIASGNAKKRAELVRLIGPLGHQIAGLDDAPAPIEIVEDRPDFAGNAAVKATAVARAVGGWALGDDSGLCVAELRGAPGVRSARWAGPDATDRDRIDKLLGELAGADDRRAWFVCSLCLADPSGAIRAEFEGRCDGWILEKPRGAGGFGYDPVFVAGEFAPGGTPPADDAATFAELDAAAKDAISHRGRALRALIAHLREFPI